MAAIRFFTLGILSQARYSLTVPGDYKHGTSSH